MKRNLGIAATVLALMLAVVVPSDGQNFAGTIVGGHYYPPEGQPVTWKLGWTTNDPAFPGSRTYTINRLAIWDGRLEGDGVQPYFDRYAGGHKAEVQGMWITAAPPHGEGLEYVILKELLGGVSPPPQEVLDFSIANNGPLSPARYQEILGHPDPAGLFSAPPLTIDDPSRRYGDVWRLPDGRLVINIHGGHERPQIVLPPEEGPAPPSTEPPPIKPPEPPVVEPLKLCGSVTTATAGPSRFELDGNPCGKVLSSDVPSVTWIGPCGERPATCAAIPRPAAVKECPACPPAPACPPVPAPRACDPCPAPVVCPKVPACPEGPVLAPVPDRLRKFAATLPNLLNGRSDKARKRKANADELLDWLTAAQCEVKP